MARFTTGDLSVSGVNIVSSISGSHDVVAKANMLGNNDAIPNLYDPYTLAAKSASNSLIGTVDFSGDSISASVDNLFPFVTGNPGEGAPWDYFDSTITVMLAVGQGLPASVGTDAYLSSLATNPDVSLAKANAYIDSTINFFCPRVVNSLMLPGNSVGVNTKDVLYNVYPNPTSDFVSINSSANIEEISLYNSIGTLVKRYNPNVFTYTIDLRELPKGVYFAEVKDTYNTHTEKIVLK